MIKTAEVLKGLDTTALDKITSLMKTPEFDGMTELELYTWLHRLEEWASIAKQNIRTAANTAFTALKTAQPDKKTWDVTSFAQVTSAARPTSYAYPSAVIELTTKAAAAVAQAKADGTAKKTTGELDANSQVLFKTELKEV
jgi:hypothetical protein